MAFPAGKTGPLRIDPVAAARVEPSTTLRYQRAAARFCDWCTREGLFPVTAEEYDDAAVEFRNAENVSLTQFEGLVAAIEFYFHGFVTVYLTRGRV